MSFYAKSLDKLKTALTKTRALILADVRTMFVPGRLINGQFLAELEEKFLQAGMGIRNVEKIIGEVRDRWRLGKIKNALEAEGVIREQISAIWGAADDN